MEPFRFVGLIAIFMSALLLIVAGARSGFVVEAGIAGASDVRPRPLVAGESQSISETVKPPVSFAKAKTFGNSGAMSIAVGDLNGDGKADVAVAGGVSNLVEVWLGNGDGTFRGGFAGGGDGAIPDSIAIGDVNDDGRADLIVGYLCINGCIEGEGIGGIGVMLGNGDGTFQSPVIYSSGGYDALSLALGDLNHDSKLDVIVANSSSGSVAVLLGNGDGTFQTPVSYDTNSALSLALADVNGDGHLDLVVSGNSLSGYSAGLSVLLGNGDGTFQYPVSYSWDSSTAVSVAVGDINGDGFPDIIAASYSALEGTGSVCVLLGNGDGTFQAATIYNSGGYGADSVTIADINGDGHPDLIVTNECVKLNPKSGSCYLSGAIANGDVSVLIGNGDGTFQVPVQYGSGGENRYFSGTIVVADDLNDDGRSDLMVANSASYNVGTLLNSFTAATSTKVTSSLNPVHVNEPITFTATVSSESSVPDGSVIKFQSGASQIGTGTTRNGTATLVTSFSAAGKYTIKASYPEDAFHKASSGTVRQGVVP